MFCCYCQCTQIEVDPLQIRLILVLSVSEYYSVFTLLSGISVSALRVKEASLDDTFRF